MKDSKLIRLLKTFSKDEWKEFEKFADSPYFNKGRNYSALVKYFKGIDTNSEKNNPTPEKIYAALFPGKTFNKNVINTILSGFTKLTKEFLIQSDFDNSGYIKEVSLLRQLEKRNCDELLQKEVMSVLKENEAKLFDLTKLDILKSIQDYLVRSYLKTRYDKKMANPVLRRSDYSFFIFYLNMLNEERDLRVMKNNLNKTHPDRLSAITISKIDADFILSYIDKNYPELSGTLGLLIRCFVSKDFYKIKKTYFENYHLLEPTLARNISYVIEGLLFDLLSEGKREFLRERFSFLKFLNEKDLLIDRRCGIIPSQPIDNAIYYSFWNKEFEWLESFIENNKNSFSLEIKIEYVRYANAYILYSQNKFSESLNEIKHIGNVPFSIKRRSKELELQLLFELKDFDSLQYAIDNYLKFIKNQTVSPLVERAMKSNFRSINSFLKAYLGNDKYEYINIKKNILKEIPTQFGDWLLEKIDELESVKK